MASVEDLIMRSVFAFLLAIMTGINVWQYVTSTYDPSHPHWQRVYLAEAVITALAGLYLFVSTVI